MFFVGANVVGTRVVGAQVSPPLVGLNVVGVRVVLALGRSVGRVVGLALGRSVGLPVGLVVGALVGEVVGAQDGVQDGAPVAHTQQSNVGEVVESESLPNDVYHTYSSVTDIGVEAGPGMPPAHAVVVPTA